MAMANQIQESVQRLPTAFQAEVLDFVEYLLAKAEREALRHEEQAWSSLSLATAMRDMGDEIDPLYTLSDVKVAFQ
jgi:hypothetical protein